MIRPYSGGKFRFQFHNTVNMIGHHDKFTQNHIRKMICNFQPTFIGNTARIIQYHFAIFNFPEQMSPVLAHDGYKIQSCLRIIISLQADGSAMVDEGIIGHGAFLLLMK